MAVHRSSIDLEYVFLDIKLDVQFLEGAFTDDEEKEIRDFISLMSREIHIDRSYVECLENKRRNVFILEAGWNSLQDVMLDTQFCQHLHAQGQEVVADAFITMIRCYIYDCLAAKTDKFTDISICIDEDSTFNVVVCKDVAHDYKTYVGPWQSWKYDLDGNFMQSKTTDEVNNTDEQH